MYFLNSINSTNLKHYVNFFPESVIDLYNDDEVSLYGFDDDDVAIGAAAVRSDGVEAELVWLYIASDYRNMGAGSEIFADLILMLQDDGNERLTVMVPSRIDEGLTGIMKGYDFEYEERGESTYYTTLEELLKVDYLSKKSESSIALSDVSDTQLAGLCQRIEENGAALVGMPIDRSEYRDELSAVYLEGSEARGIFLVKDKEPGVVRVALMYSESKNSGALLDMMRFSVSRAKDVVKEKLNVELDFISEELTELGEKLLGGQAERMMQATLDLRQL